MNFTFLNQQVQNKRNIGQYRQVRVADSQLVNFASNDYLGLNGHPDIVDAFQSGLADFGTSSCSASLISGHTRAHQYLQDQICEWLGTSACLLFSSGYAANSGFFASLLKSGQVEVLFDRLCHASMLSQMFHYPKSCQRFKHNDALDLQKRLLKSDAENVVVAIEGVYSMDGYQGNISALHKQAIEHGAALYIDDAHGIGVNGTYGQGSCSTVFSDVPDNVTQMFTFGKALATSGAAIAGSKDLIEYLTNVCSEYIFSTAMSAANAKATTKSIEICQTDVWRREKLRELQELFADSLAKEIRTTGIDSPIIGIYTGSEERTLAIAECLRERGLFVSAIRPPTVKPGSSRLRVTLSTNHNDKNIKALAYNLNQIMEKESLAC
ncbi:aminotransferase class I/II-fold pyridoxal phosphate-dependent enzyme [Thalassotalea mangrovi]|uniref:8-amino-7-oxononanoate synthase n=1 Tax=Thalassotalea mangrovi TaxID=2572245 RepID=A0A4U1B4C5_9GAMM|nr:8-amino-7-oxononanoate synthase [Thalassotalea mangrovi]TKB44884.1 8-amino-7-oxononanoate synthase [Thalassotalea mangrovi]